MNSHDHTVYCILSNGKKVPLIRLSGQLKVKIEKGEGKNKTFQGYFAIID